MGRYAISKKAGLSNAKVRSILENLKDDDLVYTGGKSSGRKGTSLSLSGRQLLMKINGYLSTVFKDEAAISANFLGYNYPYHCLIFSPNQHDVDLSTSLEIRDNAVRNGAQGAIVLTWSDDKQTYVFPDDENQRVFEPDGENNELPVDFVDDRCREGIVIISFGFDEGKTNLGGLAAACKIFENQLHFLEKYLL